MADEPTLGEIGRGLESIRRAMDQLSSKVLTVDVWKAEREAMEFRIRETEKDIATLEAKTQADRDKAATEKKLADTAAAQLRRQAVFAIMTSIVGPIATGVILALVLK